MNWRVYLTLFTFGLISLCIPAIFQQYPGYMDADYYYSVGLQIINGFGLNELVLWNYLDDPAGLPHPSNAYWMPLPGWGWQLPAAQNSLILEAGLSWWRL